MLAPLVSFLAAALPAALPGCPFQDDPALSIGLAGANLGARGALELDFVGLPVVGSPFGLRVLNGPPKADGVVAISSVSALAAVPALDATIFVDPSSAIVVPVRSLDSGESDLVAEIAEVPAALAGLELVAQAAVLDASAPGGVAVSDARVLRFGVGHGARPLSGISIAAHEHFFVGAKHLADLDDDGVLDLLLLPDGHLVDADDPETAYEALFVFRGTNQGAFEPAGSIDVASVAVFVATGDLDGDGSVDAIVTGGSAQDPAGALTIVWSVGSEERTRQDLGVGGAAGEAFVRDADGDGDEDLVFHRPLADELAWIENLGSRQFAPVANYFEGDEASLIDVLDVDQDGVDDLVLLSGWSTLSLVFGLPGGGFGEQREIDFERLRDGVRFEDLDGDGDLDLVGVSLVLTFDDPDAMAVEVVLQGPGRTFQTLVPSYRLEGVGTFEVADLDADGVLDLVVSNSGATSYSFPEGFSGHGVWWLPGVGDGSFLAPQLLWRPTAAFDLSYVFGVVDLDGDGRLDVLVDEGRALFALRGRGDGTVEPHHHSFGPPTYEDEWLYAAIAGVADLDRDGRDEISVHFAYSEEVSILDAGPQRTIEERPRIAFAGWVGACEFADLDRDGWPDVVATIRMTFDDGYSRLQVALGAPDGSFSVRPPQADLSETVTIAAGDFDRDGFCDLVTVGSIARVAKLQRGRGDGTFEDPVVASGLPLLRPDRRPIVRDLDGDGWDDMCAVTDQGDLVVAFADGWNQFDQRTLSLGAPVESFDLATPRIGEPWALFAVTDRLWRVEQPSPRDFASGTIVSGESFPAARALEVADFDNDGVADAVPTRSNGVPRLHLGIGEAAVATGTSLAVTRLSDYPLVAGDFDGDGLCDFVCTQPYTGPIVIGFGQQLSPP